jgi:uracil-DNA glycosylase
LNTVTQLRALHHQLQACRACPKMIGPVVHGPPVDTRLLLIGQAPGPREGQFGRPFAWTAGKTLFSWFQSVLGVDEETFREHVYIAAVARCFPGKAKGGGDRRPDPEEARRCGQFLRQEMQLLKPRLILPVGTLAIENVLGEATPLANVVGHVLRREFYGVETDVICLPHPSGASTWHRMEPGKTLLKKALRKVAKHPEVVATFAKAPLAPSPKLPPRRVSGTARR